MLFGAGVMEVRYYYSRDGERVGRMEIVSYAAKLWCATYVTVRAISLQYFVVLGGGPFESMAEIEGYADQVFGSRMYFKFDFAHYYGYRN